MNLTILTPLTLDGSEFRRRVESALHIKDCAVHDQGSMNDR